MSELGVATRFVQNCTLSRLVAVEATPDGTIKRFPFQIPSSRIGFKGKRFEQGLIPDLPRRAIGHTTVMSSCGALGVQF
jgi:hypothetical protein